MNLYFLKRLEENMRTNIIFFTFIIFITAASTVLNAYESDSDKPIFLESDSANGMKNHKRVHIVETLLSLKAVCFLQENYS